MLEIKYRKVFPIFMLVCCAIIFWATALAGFTPTTLTGLILLPVSILMLTRNVVIIKTDCIEMKNLLGMTMKIYPYTPEQISIQGNSLYVNQKKVLSTLWAGISNKQLKTFFLNIP